MAGCTAVEQELAKDPNNHLTCLNRAESLALFASMHASVASLIVLSWLFLRILVNVINHRRRFKKWWFFKYPIEVYLLSLFFGDFLEALGEALNWNWAISGKVEIGNLCRAQAFIATTGETASALSTLAIAVHTFFVVWWDKLVPLVIPYVVVGIIWTFVILCPMILLVSTPERRHELFVPTPYWCWIGGNIHLKLLTFYFWLWLAMLVSLLCHSILFFWKLGYIARKPGDSWWRFQIHRRRERGLRFGPGFAFYMILYPTVYFVLGLPLSIVRWRLFVDSRLSLATTLATCFIYDLSGICNYLLFNYTRRGLFLFDPEPSQIMTTISVGKDVGTDAEGKSTVEETETDADKAEETDADKAEETDADKAEETDASEVKGRVYC